MFLASLLVLLASGWLASCRSVESDVLEPIPKGNAQVGTFRDASQRFGGMESLVILLEAGEEEGAEDLEDFADLLAGELEAREELVETAAYRLDLEGHGSRPLSSYALFYLPADALLELARRLSGEPMRARAGEVRSRHLSLGALFFGQLDRNDPFGLLDLPAGPPRCDLSDGYPVAWDGCCLPFLVRPAGPSQDLDFDAECVGATRAAAGGVREELRAGRAGGTGVAVRLAGHHAIALEKARLVENTVQQNLLLSLGVVAALSSRLHLRSSGLERLIPFSARRPRLGEASAEGDPGVAVNGTNMAGIELRKLLRRDGVAAVGAGLARVFLLLLAKVAGFCTVGLGSLSAARSFGIGALLASAACLLAAPTPVPAAMTSWRPGLGVGGEGDWQ